MALPKCDGVDCDVCVEPELDPATPESAIDAELRALGVDPDELGKRASAFVAGLFANSQQVEALQGALNLLCQRRAWGMVERACSCERETAFWCGYHRGSYVDLVVPRLTRFLAFVALREAGRGA